MHPLTIPFGIPVFFIRAYNRRVEEKLSQFLNWETGCEHFLNLNFYKSNMLMTNLVNDLDTKKNERLELKINHKRGTSINFF